MQSKRMFSFFQCSCIFGISSVRSQKVYPVNPPVWVDRTADGIRQRFHFRDDCGLSVYTEGLRVESLEWDKEGDTFHICLEKILEEDRGSITAEARDCAVEIVRTSEGIREDNCTDGKITLKTVSGTESDDGYWIDLAIRRI